MFWLSPKDFNFFHLKVKQDKLFFSSSVARRRFVLCRSYSSKIQDFISKAYVKEFKTDNLTEFHHSNCEDFLGNNILEIDFQNPPHSSQYLQHNVR